MYAAACLEDVVCEDEPAPEPPCGFQHATGAVVIGQPLVHRRHMYRFDRPCGWMNATFEAPSTGREFKVRCSDGDVLFLDFYRTKHDANRGWVLLDAVDTEDATETNAICTVPHGWELIAKPDLSRTSLRNPTEQFPELFLDVAGNYVVGLIVTDWNGIRSEQAICDVMIEPDSDMLYVAMSWDTSNSDLDLHMVPEDEEMWGCNDASWCNPDADWNDEGEGWGTPIYALDNTSGYGPENINVKNPSAYQYNIRVHYWADRGGGESLVSVSIYILGVKVDVTPTARMNSRQRWDVGHVQFYETEESGELTGVFVPSGEDPYATTGSCDEC